LLPSPIKGCDCVTNAKHGNFVFDIKKMGLQATFRSLPFITGEIRGRTQEPRPFTFSSSLTHILLLRNLHKKNIKLKLMATSNKRTAITTPVIRAPVQKLLLLLCVLTPALFAGDLTRGLWIETFGGGAAVGVSNGVGESRGCGGDWVDNGGGLGGIEGGGEGGSTGDVLN